MNATSILNGVEWVTGGLQGAHSVLKGHQGLIGDKEETGSDSEHRLAMGSTFFGQNETIVRRDSALVWNESELCNLLEDNTQ